MFNRTLNFPIRAWTDNQVKSRNDAYKHCAVLTKACQFPRMGRLNSQTRPARAERDSDGYICSNFKQKWY